MVLSFGRLGASSKGPMLSSVRPLNVFTLRPLNRFSHCGKIYSFLLDGRDAWKLVSDIADVLPVSIDAEHLRAMETSNRERRGGSKARRGCGTPRKRG